MSVEIIIRVGEPGSWDARAYRLSGERLETTELTLGNVPCWPIGGVVDDGRGTDHEWVALTRQLIEHVQRESSRSRPDPTVVLRSGPSFIALDDRGEVIETVETHDDGSPDWSEGGVCDARGTSHEAFMDLYKSLLLAESNAEAVGLEVRRLSAEATG